MKKIGNKFEKILLSIIIFSLLMMEGLPLLNSLAFVADVNDSTVDIKAYFSGENIENSDSLICDVNDETIKINFEVSVKGDGYFKNGVLRFDNDMNFALKVEDETSLKDNQMKLPMVNSDSNLNISIPICFEDKENFDLQNLSKDNKIVFEGEYVDSDLILHSVKKELSLTLSWDEVTESKIDCQVVKNLNFERNGLKGKILQTNVKLSGNKENRLPIKATELMIDVPMQEGLELTSAYVDVNKLSYTQGREEYNSDFGEANYRLENGKVIINIENNAIDGGVYRSIGEDSYILTFIYNGETAINEDIVSKINANVTNYNGNVETVEKEVQYSLYEDIGEVVQYFRENKETPINKGYLMANSNQEKYEIEYSRKDILSISSAEMISGIEISDSDEYFVDESGAKTYYTTDCSYYKTTEFSKENLVKILGENGLVEILNMQDEVIGKITCDMESDENGMYVVEYGEKISAIKIRFSMPVADGNITVENTKAIKQLEFSRDEIKTFNNLVSHAEGFVTYKEGVSDDLNIAETSVEIKKTVSNATLDISQTEFSTTSLNGNVNFQIKLNNNDVSSDCYQNPVFEIRLPQAIKEAKIKNINLFYANGELEIANVESLSDGTNQIIRVTLSGVQNAYNFSKETNGTVISLDVDLTVDEFTGNVSEIVEMYYYNEAAVKYNNQTEWNMVIVNENISHLGNGYAGIIVSYRAPDGLLNGQGTETKEKIINQVDENIEKEEEDSNKVISLNQGPQSDLLQEGVEAKLATMYISVMNNTKRSYTDFKILGRIPFIGNKEITTGNDLGTTVDTILDTEITTKDDGLNYTVYYSENGEATEDLLDENNGWKTDFYKAGAVKSYLIILNDYTLTPNKKLEFNYDYVIPANLKAGDAFYGTYTTFYKEESTQLSSEGSADKIGYEIEDRTDITASIKLVDEKLKEFSKATYNVTLKNETNVAAKGLVLKMEIPNEFFTVGDNVNIESNNDTTKTITMDVPDLEAQSEKVIDITFNIYKFDSDNVKVKLNSVIEGRNLNNTVICDTEELLVEKTKVDITDTYCGGLKVAGSEYINNLLLKNMSDETFYDLVITKKLGDSLEFSGSDIDGRAYNAKERASILDEYITNEEGFIEEERSVEMDEKFNALTQEKLDVNEEYYPETNTIKWTIKKFEPGDTLDVDYSLYIKIMDDAQNVNSEQITTMCDLNNGEVLSNINDYEYNQSNIEVRISNNNETGYVKPGDEATYVWEINNKNNYDVTDFVIEPNISENAEIIKIKLETPTIEKEYHPQSTKRIYAILPANSTSRLIVTVKIENVIESNNINSFVNMKYDGTYVQNVNTVTEIETAETDGKRMSGTAYVDENNNQILDSDDKVLSGVIVNLYNSETNKLVDSQITDICGRYDFKNLIQGTYYVKFKYDDTKYVISSNNAESANKNKAKVLNVNNGTVTDNIKISENSVSGIDIGLNDDNVFDMSLNAEVNRITVQNSSENTVYEPENKSLGKVDINPKLVSDSKVIIEYKIIVKNQGTIPGKVEKIIDYKPFGIEFDSSMNSDWYIESDGNICTTVLKDDVINPGETRALVLILSKKMTDDNTGLIYNSIEIAKASNDKGISDIDSKPGNKLNEDDLSVINTIIGVSTGGVAQKIIFGMFIIVLCVPLIILIWWKIDKRRYV